ncbi:YybH family protein [Pedobacter hartonius]|uniref:DUF4440 domain-containing protein n=1 Tax=Pedobacter hartonius TaxID=425514 RepID=A0A1H4H2R2_9SPHI|nr:nuclear transport factor 2 family protein [Pedobacter hartonius]SEB15282.1 conserved hypothetical protein [Pedobacter hartonius]
MKKITLTLIALLFGCVVLVGFTAKNHSGITAEAAQPSDIEAAKKEIALLNRQFSESLRKADAEAAAKVYTTDAKYMSPNLPAIQGRKNIEQFYNQVFVRNGLDLVLTTVEVWGDKNMVTEEGTYVFKANESVELVGKYLAIWKKEDGMWRIFRQCYNPDTPAN